MIVCVLSPLCSELVSNVAVEGEEGNDSETGDAPSVSMTTASTAYSWIETSHSVFSRVKRLWNSPSEDHREVSRSIDTGR